MPCRRLREPSVHSSGTCSFGCCKHNDQRAHFDDTAQIIITFWTPTRLHLPAICHHCQSDLIWLLARPPRSAAVPPRGVLVRVQRSFPWRPCRPFLHTLMSFCPTSCPTQHAQCSRRSAICTPRPRSVHVESTCSPQSYAVAWRPGSPSRRITGPTLLVHLRPPYKETLSTKNTNGSVPHCTLLIPWQRKPRATSIRRKAPRPPQTSQKVMRAAGRRALKKPSLHLRKKQSNSQQQSLAKRPRVLGIRRVSVPPPNRDGREPKPAV